MENATPKGGAQNIGWRATNSAKYSTVAPSVQDDTAPALWPEMLQIRAQLREEDGENWMLLDEGNGLASLAQFYPAHTPGEWRAAKKREARDRRRILSMLRKLRKGVRA